MIESEASRTTVTFAIAATTGQAGMELDEAGSGGIYCAGGEGSAVTQKEESRITQRAQRFAEKSSEKRLA